MGLPKPQLVSKSLASEYDEVQKRLAALCERAAQLAERLNTVALPMDLSCALRAFDESPTTAEIQELANEIQAVVDRRRQLEALLRNTGSIPIS